MGWVFDVLKDIPLSAVLREKLATMEAEHAKLETDHAILKDDLREARNEISKLKGELQKLSPGHQKHLDETAIEVLHIVLKLGDQAWSETIESQSSISLERVRFHLQDLQDSGLLEFTLIDPRRGFLYGLTQESRKVLIDQGLL